MVSPAEMRNSGRASAVVLPYIFTLVAETAQYPAHACKSSHYINSIYLFINHIIATSKQNTCNSRIEYIVEKHDQ